MDPTIVQVIKWTVGAVAKFLNDRPRLSTAPTPDIESTISRNVVEALQWASTLQIFGMTRSADPAATTVPLRLAETPRRFRGKEKLVEQPEAHILDSGANILLLGDPGSGKTTTLKRLTKQLVIGDLPDEIPNTIPVVIRLRDLATDESLVACVASKLGMQPTKRRETQTNDDREKGQPVDLWLGLDPAKDVIADFLRHNRTLLIFDGLDEFPGGPNAARNDLNWFARTAQGSQIIVSCRSGDYYGVLEGYLLLELCPLDDSEIDKIIELNNISPVAFRQALSGAPYADLIDRPLFLAQLLLIFSRYDYLPKYASDTYSLIVGLMLREWDAERGIRRQSHYAAFSPDRKRAFLAAISYFLTYRIKRKAFTSRDLQQTPLPAI